MVYGMLLYFSQDIFNNFNKKSSNIKSPQVLKYQNKLKTINSKIIIKNKLSTINILEENHRKYKIFTESITIQEYKINLKLSGNYIDLINLLRFYQVHFSIIYFKLYYVTNKLYAEISINTKYFFNKDNVINNIKSLENPFFLKKIRKQQKQIEIKQKVIKCKILRISAIIKNEVLIDNLWYKRGDIVNNNKILDIKVNNVKFLDIEKNKKYILKICNE